jgi:hypothetical protein
MATSQVDVACAALAHLPASESTPAQVYRIEAWLAAKQGNHATERQTLERLIAAERSDRTALKRLSELARRVGQSERTPALQRRACEIDWLNAQYRKLYDRNQPIRDAVEMGQLALRLQRTLEARVFLTVAAAESLHPNDARREFQWLSKHSTPIARTRATLAEAILSPKSGTASSRSTD